MSRPVRGSGRKGASVGVVVEVEGVANSAVTVGLVVGVMKRVVKCTRDLIYLKEALKFLKNYERRVVRVFGS